MNEFVPITCIPENFLGRYEINKLGHIKDLTTGNIKTEFCLDEGGYKLIYLRDSSGNVSRNYLHVLLAKTFIPNPDNKPVVDHIDRNRANNDLSNLRWATYSENARNKESQRKKNLVLEKYDDNWKLIEKIPVEDLDPYIVRLISGSIIRGHKSQGYNWKLKNLDLEDYISRFGEPKEEDWKECLRVPEIECNINGMLRKKGSKRIYIGSKDCKGYRITSYCGKPYRIHRLVYETFSGRLLDDNELIDHINTIRDDNRFSNLKACTQKENLANPLTRKKKFVNRKIKQFSMEGKLLKTFDSPEEVCKSLKETRKHVLDATYCVLKYGYLWCYEGDEDKIKNKVKKLVFKYNKDGKLVEVLPTSFVALRKCKEGEEIIGTGKECSDGYFYYYGPKPL